MNVRSLPIMRREMLLGCGAMALGGRATPGEASGAPVVPTWESLASHFKVPDWFRDAKFGIWAHWGPQCQPEFGDWYARLMYIQGRLPWQKGETSYEHHLAHYGHPSRTGFIDIIGDWKAQDWQPEYLLRRYVAAGARYFMAMGCHHDNFDLFASRHHGWNSLRLGPKRDIVGTWEPLVRDAGLKFGISNHSSHAWHWYQVAYGYDAEGPMRGRRYDAYRLRKRDGRGTFWEGLDPQELYTGPYYVPPTGIPSAAAMNAWHDARDGQWIEAAPPFNPDFVRKWRLRQKQIVDDYSPDLVYFDDTGLPLGRAGLDAAAHCYNHSLARHGDLEIVLFGKKLDSLQRHAIVEDVERGWVDEIRPLAWQTDTCIGNWHYDRRLYEENGYKSAGQVIQRLADVVSKNGNLLLNIPVRGNGTIDDKEEAVLDGITRWTRRNGEAIFATRPWRLFGEGPTRPPAGMLNEDQAKPFTSADIRFTAKAGALYAIFMEWPVHESAIASLATGALPAGVVERVDLLAGADLYRPLPFRRGTDGLRVTLPPPDGGFAPVIRLVGRGLA